MTEPHESAIAEAAEFLRSRGFDGGFACAMVLGTGLGPLAEDLADPVSLAYADIPHYPRSGVSGHAGRLVAGQLAGRRVLVFQGRAHAYERGDAAAMRVPVGVAAALGAPILVLTNAAGSTRRETGPGSLVLLTDHINLAGLNPLIGLRSDRRFVSLTDAYDEALRRRFSRAARRAGVTVEEGIYAWFSGPSFETPAEIRMARLLGADLVGMSTVPEAILARYFGLKVLAVSTVTNHAAGMGGASPSHAETQAVAAGAAARLGAAIRAFLAEPDHE